MKRLIISIFLVIQVLFSYSQSNQLDDLHNVFTPLDKSKIPTGILSDYGVQLVSFNPFNGILTDSSYTTFDAWQMLYTGLYSSAIRSDIQMEDANSVVDRLKAVFTANHNTVFVPVIGYSYACLNPDAATLGLITISNGQLYDIPNKNPYQTKTLFAASPSKDYAKGSSIPFSFRSDMYLTNFTATVSRIDVDFGNGNGYVQVYLNTPYNANFKNSGEVEIKVKFTLSTGILLYSHFKIYIEVPPSQAPMAYPSVPINPKSGVHSGGKISWRLSSQNNTGKIRQPLIIAEGFDPLAILLNDNYNLDAFIKSINWFSPINSTNTFLGDLDYSKYDIVFLDYADGIDDIFRNAKLFEEVIDWVNSQKVGVTGAQPNVVMGLSMGGLVAKTALRNMELTGKHHDTRLFISVDSPHKGANVPVGFQAMIRHMEDLKLIFFIPFPFVYNISNNIDMIHNSIKVLDSPAAKQMLKYSVVLNNGDLVYDNTQHEAFQQQYDAMGFPTQCRNVAVSNGSVSSQSVFPAGSDLIDLYEKKNISFFWSFISWMAMTTNYPKIADIPFITYNSDILVDLNVKGIPDRQIASVYDGRIAVKKRILYFITKEINLTRKSLNSTSTMLPFDGAPGGNYAIDFSNITNIDPSYLAMIDNALKQKIFTFIPTASSLAVSSTNPLDRLDNVNLISTGSTPFANYFAQQDNEQHTEFTPQNARFILDELAGGACTPPYGLSISDPSEICSSSATYSVNYPSYPCTSIIWSKSSNLTLIGSNTGNSITIQPTTIGTAGWVNVTLTGIFAPITLSKDVWVGKPTTPTSIGNFSSNGMIFSPGSAYDFSAIYANQGENQYNWIVSGGSILEGQGTNDITVETADVTTKVSFSIKLKTGNSCGWSPYLTRTGYVGGTGPMFVIYPNPASTEVSISQVKGNTTVLATSSSKAKTIRSISVVDKFGHPVLLQNYGDETGEAKLNISSLPIGIYVITINKGTDQETHTFIKE